MGINFHSQEYYESMIYPRISEKREPRVVIGEPALNYCGLGVTFYMRPCMLTPYRELNHLFIPGVVHYHYAEVIDPFFETRPAAFADNIRLPSQERALIDCIRLDELPLDEGTYLDAFYSYLANPNFDKLRFVTDHLGVAWDTVQYWIDESNSYGSEM